MAQSECVGVHHHPFPRALIIHQQSLEVPPGTQIMHAKAVTNKNCTKFAQKVV